LAIEVFRNEQAADSMGNRQLAMVSLKQATDSIENRQLAMVSLKQATDLNRKIGNWAIGNGRPIKQATDSIGNSPIDNRH
jgi:hypothetical protein